MKKSFRAILIENEQKEFAYYVKSIRNIHDDETLERIRMGLLTYGLVTAEVDKFTPISAHNEDFEAYPNTPCYCVCVTMEYPTNPEMMCQAIASYANIPEEYLCVEPKDKAKLEKAAEEDATKDDEEPQALVGDRRIGDFMKELETERKERETIEKDVYESIMIAYDDASRLVGRQMRRGFYLLESRGDSAKMYGPFPKVAANVDFVEFQGSAKVIRETKPRDGQIMVEMTLFDPSGSQMVQVHQEHPFQVEVENQDTGRIVPVVVKAVSDTEARNKAVTMVAKANKVPEENLIARDPTELGNR